MGRYLVLEDVAVADCALEIEGRDLNDLFETVARAVAELMVDPATVATTVRREIALAAPALDFLLFDWIAELIFLKDSEQLILTETSVAVQAEPMCRLVARVAGGLIDREHTMLRSDAKAPTLHRFGVEPTTEGWQARVVIDI
jgi:SHS2 domain-containing protein